MSPSVIGFVGLGALGTHMARNLASSLSAPLLVWTRTTSKAQALQTELGESKIRVASSPSALAAECDVVITNLAHDDVSREIYKLFVEAVKAEPPKARTFVETSTVHPSFATELQHLLAPLPQTQFVASPVFGTPPAAAAAQLILVMSGPAPAVSAISALLSPAVGARVLEMGEDVEKAPKLKLIGNSFILGTLEVIAECQTLGERLGLGAQAAQNLAKIFYTGALCAYGDKMVASTFDGAQGFSLGGGIKDMTHVQSLAAASGVDVPALEAARQHLVRAKEIKEGDAEVKEGVWDVASLVKAVREGAK